LKDFFHSAERLFHGIDYLITITTAADSLVIEVEEQLNGERWRGQFPAECKYFSVYIFYGLLTNQTSKRLRIKLGTTKSFQYLRKC
jgi:hypothetical protein